MTGIYIKKNYGTVRQLQLCRDCRTVAPRGLNSEPGSNLVQLKIWSSSKNEPAVVIRLGRGR